MPLLEDIDAVTPWDGILPGACAQPEPTAPPRGLNQFASDAGTGLREMVTAEPSQAGVRARERMDLIATRSGELIGVFRRAVEGIPWQAPPEPEPPPSTVGDPAPAPSSGVALAARAAASAGWTGEDLVTAVAIVGPESHYIPTADNPTSSAAGLWQVMVSAHGDKIAGRDIEDPYVNASVAYQIWQEAGGFAAPWPTFRSGAHLPYMDAARAAVAALPGTGVVQAGYTPAADCEPGVIPAVDMSGRQPGEDRLTTDTIRVRRTILTVFGPMTVGGFGYRDNPTEHDDGRALDFMTYEDRAKGQAIAEYLAAHATELRIMYVMWDSRIHHPGRDAPGVWRPVADRGSPTANHLDHVHVSVLGGGVTA